MSNTDPKTNGRNRVLVARLIEEVRAAIDATYYDGEKVYPNGSRYSKNTDDARAVRDYVTNMSPFDKFEDLLSRETAHERRHRRGRPEGSRIPISANQGAAIVMLHQIGNGAKLEAMPAATLYISCRDTAAEAITLGYCAREELRKRPELLAELEALDYAGAVRS